MNSKDITTSDLFRDRPLSGPVNVAKHNSTRNYRALLDFASDRRAAFLDSLLQILLAACLLSSLAVCGWNLGSMSGVDSATPTNIQQSEAATKPAAPTPATCSVAAAAHRPMVPRPSTALTVQARLF